MRPDGIPIKVWMCLRDMVVVWLLSHLALSFNNMPQEWRKSTLVPIFRIKKIFKVVFIRNEAS